MNIDSIISSDELAAVRGGFGEGWMPNFGNIRHNLGEPGRVRRERSAALKEFRSTDMSRADYIKRLDGINHNYKPITW